MNIIIQLVPVSFNSYDKRYDVAWQILKQKSQIYHCNRFDIARLIGLLQDYWITFLSN